MQRIVIAIKLNLTGYNCLTVGEASESLFLKGEVGFAKAERKIKT